MSTDWFAGVQVCGGEANMFNMLFLWKYGWDLIFILVMQGIDKQYVSYARPLPPSALQAMNFIVALQYQIHTLKFQIQHISLGEIFQSSLCTLRKELNLIC